MRAVPLPDLRGKSVLDVGCDAGSWCWHAAESGAVDVLGLDRGREVRGRGFVDIVAENRQEASRRGLHHVGFERINLGSQWIEFGRRDVVLVLSVYHHIFEQCGHHAAIWFWLRRHINDDGVLLWEGPVDDRDPVVRANVSGDKRAEYTLERILAGAAEYFIAEKIGPALHEPTREVWCFTPKPIVSRFTPATMRDGAGGATPAFEYEGGRRIAEIETILGMRPVAGSLNLSLAAPFDWDRGYFRARVLDVTDRALGLASAWSPRWARFYPLAVNDRSAFAFRFEGEKYDLRFMELIADRKLRDVIAGPKVTLCR